MPSQGLLASEASYRWLITLDRILSLGGYPLDKVDYRDADIVDNVSWITISTPSTLLVASPYHIKSNIALRGTSSRERRLH